ncbi:isochorismatase family protein [Candidatus Woesearchaeota archaeon]|nr:isochorismatase family protein [Candidatus Woesearchaeota archaeon]
MLDTNGLGIVIVDMQDLCLVRLVEGKRRRIIGTLEGFLERVKELDLPTIAFQLADNHCNEHLNNPAYQTVPSIKERLPVGASIFWKSLNDGFTYYYEGSEQDKTPSDYFYRRGVSKVLVIGLFAEMCVYETAKGAKANNFQVMFCDKLMEARNPGGLTTCEPFKRMGKYYQNYSELFND